VTSVASLVLVSFVFQTRCRRAPAGRAELLELVGAEDAALLAGDDSVFRALQTYLGGVKVSWIGTPDSVRPAPRVKLLAPADASVALAGPGAASLLNSAS
jgi:hypothetical protein